MASFDPCHHHSTGNLTATLSVQLYSRCINHRPLHIVSPTTPVLVYHCHPTHRHYVRSLWPGPRNKVSAMDGVAFNVFCAWNNSRNSVCVRQFNSDLYLILMQLIAHRLIFIIFGKLPSEVYPGISCFNIFYRCMRVWHTSKWFSAAWRKY